MATQKNKTAPTFTHAAASHRAAVDPSSEPSKLLAQWEEASHAYVNSHGLLPTQARLPQDLPLASAVSLFLSTLKGQSDQTAKTYRVGCRRFMWFIF